MNYELTKNALLNSAVGGLMKYLGRSSAANSLGKTGIPSILGPAVLAGGAAGLGAGYLADKTVGDPADPNKWRKRLGLGGLGGGLALSALYNYIPNKTAGLLKRSFLDYYASNRTDIPVHHSIGMIYNDPVMGTMEKAKAVSYLYDAHQGSEGTGLVSWGDVSRAAIGAGVGYGAATLFGKAVGGIFGGLPDSTQKKLQTTGVLGGILMNTGALQ